MATKKLGRIGFVDKGNWSATETYNKLDVVQVKDYGSFYSKKDGNKNSNPVTDSVNWAPVASGEYAKAQGDYAKEQGDAVKPFATDMADVNRDMGKYQQLPDVTLTLVESGKRIDKEGNFVEDSSFNIGRLGSVSKGNIYELLMGGSDKMVLGTALFVSHTIEKIGGVDKDVYKPIYSAVNVDLPISTYAVLFAGEDYSDVLVSYRNDVAGANVMKVARWGIFASIATQLANLRGDVDLKSFSDGYYDNMGVGFAKNLIGDGEATAEEFTERVAGGSHQIDDSLAEYVTIKGNSVVWNQLARVIGVKNSNISPIGQNGVSVFSTSPYFTLSIPAGSTIIAKCKIKSQDGVNAAWRIYPNHGSSVGGVSTGNPSTGSNDYEEIALLLVNPSIAITNFAIINSAAITNADVVSVKDFTISNLTQMFGAGNEPTTFAEWNARKPKVVDEFAYNEGTIVNMTVEGVKTTGRNLWDEEWETGKHFQPLTGIIDYVGGWKMSSLIKAFGNKKYYIRNKNTSQVIVGCWGGNLNYLGYVLWTNGNATFTTKPDTCYIRFEVIGNIADVCINVSDPSFNGQYESHITSERKWTETMNRCFLDGMKSAKAIFDEFTPTKATARMKKARLADFSWTYCNGRFFAYIEDAKRVTTYPYGDNTNAICSLYPIDHSYSNDQYDKTIRVNQGNDTLGYMYIRDTNYSDVPSFVAHLGDAELIYELAKPIVTTYDELNLTSRVWRNGVEEIIVPDGKESSPISADVIYQINAFKTIKANKQGIEDLNAKPAISLTAEEVTKLRALINTNTQNLEE